MWQKLADAACRMRLYADEHVGQIGDGVDAVFLAGRDECVEDGEVVAGLLVAEEEVVRAPESDPAQRSLRDVVVWRNRGVTEETSKGAVVSEQIADRLSHPRAWLEVSTMTAAPAEQFREGGTG